LKRTKIPSLWKLKLRLNFDENDFKAFCLIFRNILFSGGEKTKRNILFLLGVTNSGKSRLVLDIAKASVGIENVGTLSTDPKFLFENLVGKQIAILDEPDLSVKMLNSLKKFGSGEALNINAKFEKSNYEELTTQILAASNYTPEINTILNDSAMKSRIWKFVFENECSLSNEEHQEILTELPKILIYCNKLYFESLPEKKRLTNKNLSLFLGEKFKLLK
jgi:phage/plasmid-associated DNA primase